MRKTLRIFISSPGDVQEERLRAHLVVQKLARDYQRFFKIEPYLWEYEPMLASGHFQDAIEPPSESDIVVLVVYSRLGTPLPERTAAREYRGIDGRAPVTGTEWEFEEALEAHKNRGAPDLLAYRKTGDPQASLADAERRAEQERQWTALEAFWRRHFEGGGVFLAGSSKFKSLEEFDAKLEADLVRIIEGKIAQGLREDGGGEEASWLHASPYQGLAAYDFHDAPIFFGRDAQIRAASTRLQHAAAEGTAFLLILGASGSGKSSLARAGLLPALFAAKAVPGVGIWRRVVLRPGEGGADPVLALAKALVAGDPKDGEGLPELLGTGMGPEALAAHLQAAPDDPSFPFRQALGRIAHEARAKQGLLPHEEARLVILVDQVEELFTRDIGPDRRALFVRILAGLARSGVVWIVATVRNDLWHRAAEIPELVGLVESGARLDLLAPGGAEIIEVVRRPAAAAGIYFEKDHESGVGLDAVISRAASEEPGALPLLSVMLQSLYQRDIVEGGGRALTFAGYRALGELKGAIAQRADQALADLRGHDPDAAAALPRVLRALVTAGDDGTATSRPARLDAFAPGSPELRLVESFLAPERRLLVASERGGVAEVRLAHEALLENWPAAREQIATDRRDLQTRARLEVLQRRWAEAATPAEKKKALLTSLNLAEGVDLVRRWNMPRDAGLGAYVAQSEAAERWRRKSFALAASILVLIFAGIAAVASLQWRRAEQQTVLARAAEETERQARGAADEARREAERERDRADSEKARALAALREAKRGSARTLAAQADLAADRSEFHRALSLAVQAGETERDVVGPDEPSASQPALLKALAGYRQILHIDRPKGGGHTLPNDFYGDDKLVYADMKAGIMMAELPSGAVTQLAAFPPDTLPLNIRSLPALGLVVVTTVKNVFVVEVASRKVRAQIAFDERIGALDVNEATRTAVIGTGGGIAFISLDAPAKAEIIPVPEQRDGFFVGQVRFLPDGRKLLVGYGIGVYEYDRDAGSFGPRLPLELTAIGAGLTRELAEQVSAQGLIVLVEMRPDPARNRVLLASPLSLTSVRADGSRFEYDRDVNDNVLGVGFSGPDNSGDPVVIFGRKGETGIDIRLAYVSDEKKPLVIDDFRISASDLGTEQLQSCRVTRNTWMLACTYSGKSSQGLYVWHVLGGAHRGARLAFGFGNAVSAAAIPGETPRLLAGGKAGLLILPTKTPVPGLTWDETWRLGPFAGGYVAAASPQQVQVLRAEGDSFAPALAPTPGTAVALRADGHRALVLGPDRLAAYDLQSGRALWSVPGLPGLRAAAFGQDGAEVVALTADHAYTFDGASGRILSSRPLPSVAGAPVAIDAAARRVAFMSSDGPQLLDLATGAAQRLDAGIGPGAVTEIALDLAADRIVVALEDGRVIGLDGKGAPAWVLSPPSNESFGSSAMPGQKPRGTVLQLAISPGRRLAIVRQDMLAADLHELSSGRYLTHLTPPWRAGVPARLAFDPDDRVVGTWALHPIVREQPSAATLHALPLERGAALAAAQKALAAAAPIRPDGSRASPEAAGSN